MTQDNLSQSFIEISRLVAERKIQGRWNDQLENLYSNVLARRNEEAAGTIPTLAQKLEGVSNPKVGAQIIRDDIKAGSQQAAKQFRVDNFTPLTPQDNPTNDLRIRETNANIQRFNRAGAAGNAKALEEAAGRITREDNEIIARNKAFIEGTSRQDAPIDIPAIRSVVGGLGSAGTAATSVIARILGKQEEADAFLNMAAGSADTGGSSFVDRSLTGIARSVGTAAIATTVGKLVGAGATAVGGATAGATGATAAFFGTFAANGMNEAAKSGRDQGLTGSDLGLFVAGRGSIETITMVAFQLAGIGGTEEVVRRGFGKQLFTELGKSGFGKKILRLLAEELPEETSTLIFETLADKLAGISNRGFPTAQEFTDVFVQTVGGVLFFGGADTVTQSHSEARIKQDAADAGIGLAKEGRKILAGESTNLSPDQAAIAVREARADISTSDPSIAREALFAGLPPETASAQASNVTDQLEDRLVSEDSGLTNNVDNRVEPPVRDADIAPPSPFLRDSTDGNNPANPGVPQPDGISDDGLTASFIPQNHANPEAAARKYAQSIQEELPTAIVDVVAARDGTSVDVKITENGKLGDIFRRSIQELSSTQRRKLVRKAKEIGLANSFEEVLGLSNKKLVALLPERITAFFTPAENTGEKAQIPKINPPNVIPSVDILLDEVMNVDPNIQSALSTDEQIQVKEDLRKKISVLQDIDGGFIRTEVQVDAIAPRFKRKRKSKRAQSDRHQARPPIGGLNQSNQLTIVDGFEAVQDAAKRGDTTVEVLVPVQSADAITRMTRPGDRRILSSVASRKLVDAKIAAGDIKAARQEIKKLRKQIRTDPGTGVGNKVSFGEAMDQIESVVKNTNTGQAFLFFDAANLKAANDALGPAGADKALKDIATKIQNTVVERGLVHRVGGDEFAVTFLKPTSKGEVAAIRAEVEAAIGRAELAPQVSMFLAGGIGVITPNGSRSDAINAASAEMTARKKKLKTSLGEPTDRAGALAALKNPKAKARQDKKVVDTGVDSVLKEVGIRQEATRKKVRQTGPIGKLVGLVSARMRRISPATFLRTKKAMFNISIIEENLFRITGTEIKTVKDSVGGWKSATGMQVWQALLNDRTTAAPFLSSEAKTAVEQIGKILDNLHTIAQAAGIDIGFRPGHFPRVVKDVNGVRQLIGKAEQGQLTKAIAVVQERLGRAMTIEERDAFLSKYVAGFRTVATQKAGPRHSNPRSIETVTPDMLKFYHNPSRALNLYIRDMVQGIERARFFGKETSLIDLDKSVGEFVGAELDAGNISVEQERELTDLIRATWTGLSASSSTATRALRQLQYLSWLTQIRSSLKQLSDVATSAFVNGGTNTLKSIGEALSKNKRMKRVLMQDIGLHDVGAEYEDLDAFGKTLDLALKANKFRAFDRFGKEIFINASKRKFTQIAANPDSKQAKAEFNKVKDIFARDQWDSMLSQWRTGTLTEDMRFMLFLDISQVQPIDFTEVPEFYANNAELVKGTKINSRILGTFATFTLKRLSFLRTETVGQWKAGNRIKALKNLGTLILLWEMAEIPIDLFAAFINGTLRVRDIPVKAVENFLNIFLLNRFSLRAFAEDPVEATVSLLTSRFSNNIVTTASADLKQALTGTQWNGFNYTPGIRVVRHIPLLGEVIYYRTPLGEGFHIQKKKDRQAAKDKYDKILSRARAAIMEGDSMTAGVLLKQYNNNLDIVDRKTPVSMSRLRKSAIAERG